MSARAEAITVAVIVAVLVGGAAVVVTRAWSLLQDIALAGGGLIALTVGGS